MISSVQKPTHREWRKEAKKARRKRIRQKLAELRKAQERKKENSPTHLLELEKKRLYEEYVLEKEEKEREEANRKWLEEEERAQKRWREEQRLKKLALEEKLQEQEKIRKEWEAEQKKIQEQKEKLDALKKEEEKQRKETLDRINNFICNGGDVPPELQVVTESNPGKEICSFFEKVGACRFGNQCSRNHQFLKISSVLMFVNFYSHFTLQQSHSTEYDTDIGLEFEESDMYLHFKEFYNDIVPEFKKFGEVIMVKVCCNTEIHLRGNVYVEYKSEREALVAYKNFQGRWYGGKQLNIEFVRIKDWGSAVCGDFVRHRCPKGKLCNFLHVFRNPKNEFSIDWNKHKNNLSRGNFDNFDDNHSRSRNWRWSETPEPSPAYLRKRSTRERSSSKKKRSRTRESEKLQDCDKEKSKKHKKSYSERKKNRKEE